MRSILERLYSGGIYPAEEIGTPVLAEEYKRGTAIEEEKEYFKSLLSPEDKKRYGELESLQRDSENDYALQHFTYGFSLGVRLMIETLDMAPTHNEE